ncbi:MAG: DNA repair protein RadA [Acidimicrobiia bacterium]|nr:DNA repair protein RadA [Acidimicrobiia bacterium]
MAKDKTAYRCRECGATAPRWEGRCHACGHWNTLIAEVRRPPPPYGAAHDADDRQWARAVPVADVPLAEAVARPTHVDELDRVLGGGLVPGSVTLLGGEPGVGKSTLLLQALTSLAGHGARCLLVCGEESAAQVRLRAERLQALVPNLWLVSDPLVQGVVAHVQELEPDVLAVDSVQTLTDVDLPGAPGSVSQVTECTYRIVQLAKARAMATLLVGHVTKDGALAGPRLLEHAVDTVLSFDGDRHHALRLLRAVKHRFGATGEIGLFEMGEAGLDAVADPAGLLLADRQRGVPGCVVTPVLEGQRPLLVEVQGLVSAIPAETRVPAVRSAQGLDPKRLAMLLAVLDARAGVNLYGAHVYASAVGGVRVSEPSTDLAVALALVSTHRRLAVPDDLVVCGEVGLAGEVRQVPQTGRRLAEAARLGFRRAIAPESTSQTACGVELLKVRSVTDAIELAGLKCPADN